MKGETRQILEERYKRSGKRFLLSPEQFAKERLKTLKNIFRIVHTKHPEVIAVTVFGSLTKGMANNESDIDAWVYIDLNLLSQADAHDIVQEQETLSGTKFFYFENEVKDRYILSMREELKKLSALQDDQVKHLRVLPISRDIVLAGIDQLKQRDQISDPHVSVNLYALFHLAIGTEIKEYRKFLIERLLQEGETGEKIWEIIIGKTESIEQGGIHPMTKRYPRTLTEARTIYGRPDVSHTATVPKSVTK